MKHFEEIKERLEKRGWSVSKTTHSLAEKPEDGQFERIIGQLKRPNWFMCYIGWPVWRFIDGTLFNPRAYERWWQRRTRGWDDSDTWSLDYTIAQFTLPRLKVLHKNLHGYPSEFEEFNTETEPDKGFFEWRKTIEAMIWSFEFYLDDDRDYAGDKEWKRWKKGMNLFVKYYGNLWD